MHGACRNVAPLKHVICLLLEKYPDIIKEKNEKERLPLHEACRSGNTCINVIFLISSFPDALNYGLPQKIGNGWRLQKNEASEIALSRRNSNGSVVPMYCEVGLVVERISNRINPNVCNQGVAITGESLSADMI